MRIRILSLVLLVAVSGLAAGTAFAKDATPPDRIAPTPLSPGAIDLLPFSDLEMQTFQKEHGVLIARLRSLSKRVGGLNAKLAKRKNKNDKAGKKQRADIRRLQTQVVALRARLTDELMDAGVDGALIAYMNKAPQGARRVERYAYGLVLLLDDLSDDQRLLFERVGAQMDGAILALRAQKERTALTLKQAKLERAERNQILRTFDRQERLIDQRFWQLTDFALNLEQRAHLWHLLPRGLKKKSQPVEHLYALPGLTPAQGTRLKALLTEIEHESSPDQAAVKRINAAIKKKDVPPANHKALTKERGAAYQRLTSLRRYATEVTREILTDAQWTEYEAIPPRVSTNDRRGSFKRTFSGFKPSPRQAKQIQELQRALRATQREIRRKTQAIRRDGEDYGADSPQMAGMQMQMQGMKSEGERSQRALLGRIVTEVLTPEQVTRWVMGHYGYKK